MRKLLRLIGLACLLLLVLGIGWSAFWVAKTNRQIESEEINAVRDNAPGQFIDVGGRSLHVLIEGDLLDDPTGSPLLLLHGFSAAGHATWLPWAELLSETRTIILVDMLNFGHSERVLEPHEDLTHRGQAALIANLLDALGVQRVDLAGWSMGGAIASQLALDYPQRVRTIAFVAPHIYGVEDFNPGRMLGSLPFGIGSALAWNSLGGGPMGLVARKCATSGEWCHWLPLLRIKDTVAGLQAISRTDRDSRVPHDIPQITQPVLIIAGEVDPIVSLPNNRRLARELNAELFIAPGAGHWPAEKDPERIAQTMLMFFATHAAVQ